MDAQHRAKRRRSLKLGMLSSLFSKGGTLLITALALPLARDVLGPERFVLFGFLQMLLFLVSLTDCGIGAGVTWRLTAAVSREDTAEQQRIFSTGFFLLLGMAFLAALAAVLILRFVPLNAWLGPSVIGHEAEAATALWFSLGVFLLLLVLGYLLRGREAHQEVHIYNTLGAFANLGAAALLWFGVRRFPELWWLIFALYVPQLLAFLLNGVHLLIKRPALRPNLGSVSAPMVRMLWNEGLAIFLMLGLAPILLREGFRLILGHAGTSAELEQYLILAQLGLYAVGFLNMLTLPLLPALVDSTTRRDTAWIRRQYRRTVILLLLGLVALPLGFGLIGPWFVDFWFQKDLPLPWAPMAAFGAYFGFGLWSAVHAVFYSGTGLLRSGATLVLLEAFLVLAFTAVGFWLGSMITALLCGAGVLALGSAWLHVRMFSGHLARLEAALSTV